MAFFNIELVKDLVQSRAYTSRRFSLFTLSLFHFS
jgi:hypothetical protein